MQTQEPRPLFVTLITETPTPQTTVGDVIIGSLGITGVLVAIALVAGVLMAVVRVRWNQRHPVEDDHLPPVSPLVSSGDGPRSSPGQ